MARHRRILAFDIGGTGLKVALVDGAGHFLSERLRVKTPRPCPPKKLLALLVKLAAPLKGYDAITIGFPGYVKRGRVRTAPNLGSKFWKDFPLEAALSRALGKPARLLNDADVQGLAAIKGRGLELVVTLGTGFGTAWFQDGELLPHLEFAHVPVHHKQDFDVWIGERTRRRIGHKKWAKRVQKTFDILQTVFNFDHLFIGGGNANRIDFELPDHASLVPNEDGMAGAAFAWGKAGSQAGRTRPAKPAVGTPLKKLSARKKRPGRRIRRSGSRRQKA
jgi:polyphosphate glucokinase